MVLEALKTSRLVNTAEIVDLATTLDFVRSAESMSRALRILEEVQIYRFTYTVRKGLAVTGYLATPNNGKDLPCLIHLRGGSKDFGMIDPQQLLWHIAAYAALGYVVITTQYPGVEGGGGADGYGSGDDLASIRKLRDILKHIPEADMTRIGVKGHSRGGLMAYMLLREVSWVRAAVIVAAPTDESRMRKERDGWRTHQNTMFPSTKDEILRRSPIRWAHNLPKKTPILIMHGTADWRVRASQSIRMSEALFEAGVPHRFVLFEGADHGIAEFRAEYHDMTRAWFARYLAPDRTMPNLTPHGP